MEIAEGVVIAFLLIVIMFLRGKQPKTAGTLFINKTNPEFDNYLIQIDIPFEDLEKTKSIKLNIELQ